MPYSLNDLNIKIQIANNGIKKSKLGTPKPIKRIKIIPKLKTQTSTLHHA